MVDGSTTLLNMEENTLAFTTCQVPVVYKICMANRIDLYYKNGTTKSFDSLELNEEESKKIVLRSNEISLIEVFLNENILR